MASQLCNISRLTLFLNMNRADDERTFVVVYCHCATTHWPNLWYRRIVFMNRTRREKNTFEMNFGCLKTSRCIMIICDIHLGVIECGISCIFIHPIIIYTILTSCNIYIENGRVIICCKLRWIVTFMVWDGVLLSKYSLMFLLYA